MLQDPPHRVDIIFCVTPIPLGIEIAYKNLATETERDLCDTPRHFARDERFTAKGAFVIEQYSIAGKHVVCLPIIYRNPMGVELRHSIRRPRIERRLFILRDLLHEPVEL